MADAKRQVLSLVGLRPRKVEDSKREIVSGFQDRQCSVTGPSMGCTMGAPVRRDSSRLAFRAKYHFAWRSASSMSIRRGLCLDRKSTRLNSSHVSISYAVFCLKKKKLKIYVRLPL